MTDDPHAELARAERLTALLNVAKEAQAFVDAHQLTGDLATTALLQALNDLTAIDIDQGRRK